MKINTRTTTLAIALGLLTAAPFAQAKDTKDRIDDQADQAKDRVDEAASREKDAIDRNAEVAKDKVDGNKKSARPTNSAGAEVSDTWITTKVKAKLVGDDALKGSDISVATTKDGVVTLSGTVPTESARSHAIATVRDTKGVRRVDDQLRLKLQPVELK